MEGGREGEEGRGRESRGGGALGGGTSEESGGAEWEEGGGGGGVESVTPFMMGTEERDG